MTEYFLVFMYRAWTIVGSQNTSLGAGETAVGKITHGYPGHSGTLVTPPQKKSAVETGESLGLVGFQPSYERENMVACSGIDPVQME